MRKLLLPAILITNSFFAQELVPNPSFESWVGRTPDYPTSWNCAECSKGDAHSGALGVNLSIPNTSLSKSFNTDRGVVNIESGKTYYVSFWYKAGSQESKDITMYISGSGGSRLYWGQISTTVNDGQWHKFTDSFTATSTSAGQLYLSSSVKTMGTPGNIFFDDVSVSTTNLGTSDQNKSSFKLYPKLVDESIRFSEPVEKFEIVSAEGRSIPVSYSNGDNQISLKQLQKGVYFINAKSKKGNSLREKIIKK